jgi:hypothetical protein
MKTNMRRPRLVIALLAGVICATLSPALALSSAAPDVDLSSVDYGVAVSSADGIELLATQQTASANSVDPAPIQQIIDTGQIGSPGQVGPGAPACQFSVKVHLIKSKTKSGVVHVTVQPAVAAAACTLPNTHMDATVTVYHGSGAYFTAATTSCALSTTDPCMATQSSGSKSCTSGCTGSWWGVGTFNISLVSGAFLVGQDPQCTFNSTTNNYHCVFTGNKVKM